MNAVAYQLHLLMAFLPYYSLPPDPIIVSSQRRNPLLASSRFKNENQPMKLLNKRQQDTYLRLVQELPLVSIASEEHLDAAQAMIDRLTDKKKLDGGEQAYFDALCDLVVVYEDQYHPIPAASDADLLRTI